MEADILSVGAATKGAIWTRTSELRLLQHACGAEYNPRTKPKLQEAWRCIETGEIEWRDIPTVRQCDCRTA